MSAVVIAQPCWVLEHHADGSREFIPHYGSELDALMEWARECDEARDDWLRWSATERAEVPLEEEYSSLWGSSVSRNPDPCIELVCDGCGLALGHEGEMVDPGAGMHILSSELDPVLDAEEWQVDHDAGKDHCPDCDPPSPAPAEDLARRPGPNDVPLLNIVTDESIEPGVLEVRDANGTVLTRLRVDGQRSCRVCGCTDDRACQPPCSWVEPDLCSSCREICP